MIANHQHTERKEFLLVVSSQDIAGRQMMMPERGLSLRTISTGVASLVGQTSSAQTSAL